MATKPTHEQAQLHLQVYDLRREANLRQARDWFQQTTKQKHSTKRCALLPSELSTAITLAW